MKVEHIKTANLTNELPPPPKPTYELWLNGGGVYSLVVKELLHFLSHLKRGTGYAPVLQRCFPHQITFY